MQGSIQGPLLRSGQNSAFKALGETGFPVYRMASQLRETIRRLDTGHDLARHLAIPQNDQGGDRTDWYSSFAGDVIPWNSATESERAAAYSQFESFKLAVLALSERLLTTDDKYNGGDKRVFASLLKQVIHFPDQDFVYLVDGVLVLTFWGFVHDSGEQHDPMHWLRPVSSNLAMPGTAVSPPIPAHEIAPATGSAQTMPVYAQPVTPTIQTGSRWCRWRWLLWPLLLLALLVLLLFGLRACAPSISLPVVSSTSLPKLGERRAAVPSAGQAVPVVNGAGGSTDMEAAVPGRASGQDKSAASSALASGDPVTLPPAALADSEAPTPADPPKTPIPVESAVDLTPPTSPPTAGEVTSKGPPQDPAPQGKELTIPPAIANGPAQFLDGDWKVNGGIQDTQTGKPLQLQYSFKDGNGQVSLRQSNGVVCQGAASGVMKDGQLSINNLGQAECADGSSYMIPQIECQPGTDNGTDCMGRNDGEQQFPIKMRQTNP
ncbi:SrfA family protein [Aeromonas sobria]|uniref:SrfA family protein n=1 Tax=Aeromonas sobria TaxID=646 RepID=UPI003CFD8CD6